MAQNAHINDELRAGFAGDALRKTCPTLSARMLVVMGRLWDLKSYAEAQGYTGADYDAFRSDPAQKKRLKAEAEAYLAAAGAKPDDVQSYCAVGEAEMVVVIGKVRDHGFVGRVFLCFETPTPQVVPPSFCVAAATGRLVGTSPPTAPWSTCLVTPSPTT